MDYGQGAWNINSTRPALPYDYTIYMLCRRGTPFEKEIYV